jgi:hypothetical protein
MQIRAEALRRSAGVDTHYQEGLTPVDSEGTRALYVQDYRQQQVQPCNKVRTSDDQ